MEAAIALQKFVCTDNQRCWEHSKSIIEFNGVPLLMTLLDEDKKLLQPYGLALICYLAKHDSNSNILITAGALTALQTTGRMVAEEHPELEELVSDAICKLQSYQTDNHEQEGSIKQIITEKSQVALESIQRQELTVYLPKQVNLQGNSKTSATVRRCKKRNLGALLKTRKILPFLKAKCVELALRSSMDYPGERLIMKELVLKLRLVVETPIQKKSD
ncbi:hypothetical protein REPUB_Repub04eG0013500 [Reevesia pubescens]